MKNQIKCKNSMKNTHKLIKKIINYNWIYHRKQTKFKKSETKI